MNAVIDKLRLKSQCYNFTKRIYSTPLTYDIDIRGTFNCDHCNHETIPIYICSIAFFKDGKISITVGLPGHNYKNNTSIDDPTSIDYIVDTISNHQNNPMRSLS